MIRRNISKDDAERIRRSGLLDAEWYFASYPDVVTLGMDPAEHYLFIGATLNRNPGPRFNTEFYLRVNPDVARAGVNPLLHYLKFGMREGRQIIPGQDDDVGLQDRNVDVFISCWLRKHESIHDGLANLAGILEAKRISCVFVTNSEPLLRNEKLHKIRTTFSIIDSKLYSNVVPNEPAPHWLNEIVAIQRVRMGVESSDHANRDMESLMAPAIIAYHFWKDLIERKKPKLFLIWGSSSPLSKLHIHLCNQLNIPALVFERGHFSQTLVFDAFAQGGFGAINLLPHTATLESSTATSDEVKKIIDWVRACEEVPYVAYNNDMTLGVRIEQIRKSGKNIVLFIGANDLGTGIAYGPDDTTERPSFLFSSTRDTFLYVREILPQIDPESVLIFKPHPADNHNYDYLETDNIIIVRKENINDLIRLSDICVTLATTAIARCLVESKPVVLLALSDASMKNIAYECRDFRDIPVMLRAALYRDGFNDKSLKGYAFLQHLFDNQLVGIGADVPARYKIPDLARFIEKRIRTFSEPAHYHIHNKGDHFEISNINLILPPCDYEVYRDNGETQLLEEWCQSVSVLIPVKAGDKSVKNTIESILNADCQTRHNIILICDSQSGQDFFNDYASHDKIVVLYNQRQIGFPATVNRGLGMVPGNDVVLLNSGVIVPDKWLDRLRRAAYCDSVVGTVSPMSNLPGILAVPTIKGMKISGGINEVSMYDNVLKQNNKDFIVVPSGHENCLYIKRACLTVAGYFDEISFNSEYAAVVDFCLRSRIEGFINLCATNVFVGYVRDSDITSEADKQQGNESELIADFYPQYIAEMDKFFSIDELKNYRR